MSFKEKLHFFTFKLVVSFTQWLLILFKGEEYLPDYYNSFFHQTGVKSALQLSNNIYGRWILDRMHKQNLQMFK